MRGTKTTFEVYTYFGRVISRHVCDHTKELHHRASEEARLACARYPGNAWVRVIPTSSVKEQTRWILK